MAVLVVFLDDDPDGDPAELLTELAKTCEFLPIGQHGWLLQVPTDDPRRQRTRARQARYRRRLRDARDAAPRDARDAQVDLNFGQFGGVIHSLPGLVGQEGVSETPDRDARDADARDAVTRDARDAWQPDEPATRAEKEAAQTKIRELSAQLREQRKGG
jgi:hypothetical protein